MSTYTGIGSIKTPPVILALMFRIGAKMADRGHVLRSGGAQGADNAFESGCRSASGRSEIFRMPNKKIQPGILKQSRELGVKFSPQFSAFSKGKQWHLASSGLQVLGEFLDNPSSGIICYYSDENSGTSTGTRIADFYKVPVWNLYFQENRAKFESWISL